MFNKEFIAGIMDMYQCNQFAVDRDGNVFALKPEGQFPIPGLIFDTDTADGSVMRAAIESVKGE